MHGWILCAELCGLSAEVIHNLPTPLSLPGLLLLSIARGIHILPIPLLCMHVYVSFCVWDGSAYVMVWMVSRICPFVLQCDRCLPFIIFTSSHWQQFWLKGFFSADFLFWLICLLLTVSLNNTWGLYCTADIPSIRHANQDQMRFIGHVWSYVSLCVLPCVANLFRVRSPSSAAW